MTQKEYRKIAKKWGGLFLAAGLFMAAVLWAAWLFVKDTPAWFAVPTVAVIFGLPILAFVLGGLFYIACGISPRLMDWLNRSQP